MLKLKDNNTKINLWGTRITKELINEIIIQLKYNKNLHTLVLGNTDLNDDLLIDLTIGLKLNTSLKYFNICNNNLKDRGFQTLAKVLKDNNTIEKLDISCNRLDDYHLGLFKNYLMKNTLKSLNLFGNYIGDNGVEILIDALKLNTKLKILDLRYNKITRYGINDIAHMMETNTSIIMLFYFFNNSSLTDQIFIEKCLIRNKHILDMKKQAINVYLGFGNNIPYFIKQLLLFNKNFTEKENLKYTDMILQEIDKNKYL